jgi:phage tail-like protein
VVRIGFPVQEARTYLRRHLGNPVVYRLVEAQRGETMGQVRAIDVEPSGGGPAACITAVRELPDGSPASYHTPEDLVMVRTQLSFPSPGVPSPLQPSDRIILHVPVRSYLRFLPNLFRGSGVVQHGDKTLADTRHDQVGKSSRALVDRQDDSTGTDSFHRMLLMFQHLVTTVTETIESIPTLTDPSQADPRFLPWISSWVGFWLDESLPLHQQRELVRRAIRINRTRGTCSGIEEMIRVLTSAPVTIIERKKPQPAVIGAMCLAGGTTVEDRYLGAEPPPFYIIAPGRAETSFFTMLLEDRDKFAERFGERAPAVLRRIAQIVTLEKPAHVSFTIEFDESVN